MRHYLFFAVLTIFRGTGVACGSDTRGMCLRATTARADKRLSRLAGQVFAGHPFVKLIVFVDEDVEITSAEDVLWAVTTRANLAADCLSFGGFAPMGMDPSQSAVWAAARGDGSGARRVAIDATVPHRLRAAVARSFSVPSGARR